MYISRIDSDSSISLSEFSLARCVRRIADVFCAKGGCANKRAERAIPILTFRL